MKEIKCFNLKKRGYKVYDCSRKLKIAIFLESFIYKKEIVCTRLSHMLHHGCSV